MTLINKIANFGKFYLVTELVAGASTVDIVAASDKYNLTDQKTGSLMTSGRLTVIDKNNSDNVVVIAFSNAVENGTLNGKKRYTLTIRIASDASTKMVGLANTDDGTNDVLNVIAGNSTGVFPLPADSLVLLVVGSAEYSELRTLIENAVAEIYDQSDLLASRVDFLLKAFQQRVTDDQNAFESSITTQQNDFETDIQDQFDSFVATTRQIAITQNADAKLVNISSGVWLDGLTPRSYAGVTGHNPADNTTTYYELATATGSLTTNTTGFTTGNFAIGKVTTDASGNVTDIKNYGPAYQVPPAVEAIFDIVGSKFGSPTYSNGNLKSFIDEDSVTWNITYTSDGRYSTIENGTKTYTFNYNASGYLTSITETP